MHHIKKSVVNNDSKSILNDALNYLVHEHMLILFRLLSEVQQSILMIVCDRILPDSNFFPIENLL
jgi:hypothetical protein